MPAFVPSCYLFHKPLLKIHWEESWQLPSSPSSSESFSMSTWILADRCNSGAPVSLVADSEMTYSLLGIKFSHLWRCSLPSQIAARTLSSAFWSVSWCEVVMRRGKDTTLPWWLPDEVAVCELCCFGDMHCKGKSFLRHVRLAQDSTFVCYTGVNDATEETGNTALGLGSHVNISEFGGKGISLFPTVSHSLEERIQELNHWRNKRGGKIEFISCLTVRLVCSE